MSKSLSPHACECERDRERDRERERERERLEVSRFQIIVDAVTQDRFVYRLRS